ncbi:hypothetical protein, partial [Ruegeria marisrubri]|uniref:hypothetical protein n=1 Tax=Ruegeria marisrubri TaxID=1685379 RepID=UPI0012FDC1F3
MLDTSGNPVAADPTLDGFTVDLSSPPPPPPSDPFRVEAETFTILSGFVVKNNGQGSGDQFLQAGDSGEQRASYTFTAASGTYDLGLGHFDESDGQSQMSVLVNGTQIDSFVWNLDAGGPLADQTSLVERAISGVALSTGDVIEIVGTSDGGEPLRTDYIDFQLVGGGGGGGTGAARIGVTETSDNINKSTFGSSSFEITNTGEKVITKVEFDLSPAILPDAVFDPFGEAGDTVSKELTIDSAGSTGVDTTPDASNYVGTGGSAGYEGLILTFDQALNGGFEPGETVQFSIDADPNSVRGAGKDLLNAGSSPAWDVGGISGAELIAATVTVTYADGTTSTGDLMSAGNNAGSFTVSSQASPALEPTLTVNGLAEGGTGTYDAGGPTVILNGPSGTVARVTLAKGFIQPVTNEFYNGDADDQAYAPQLDAQLATLALTDFPANNLVELQTVDVVLDGTNQDISSMFDFSGVADYDFTGEDELPLAFVAAIIDPSDGNAPMGPVTQPIFLTFDSAPGDSTAPVVQSASAPDIGPAQVGTTTTDVTVTFTDNVAIDTASIDVGDITVTG